MEIINVTNDNIATEHICCAISEGDCQAQTKKQWLSERCADGLVFKKCNVRGKCFIEYIPAEKAFSPINADGYYYIDCLWVAGQFKGKGYSSLLLDDCIADCKAKGAKGLVVLSSKKKMAFLSDPKYLEHKGFKVADVAPPYYVLYYLPFTDGAQTPSFKQQVKERRTSDDGFVLYYANQCPYTAKYVPAVCEVARQRGVSVKAVKFENCEQAQAAPAPFTSYSLFYNGEFITNEILSEQKMSKIIDEYVGK